jgi:hypothetical protein
MYYPINPVLIAIGCLWIGIVLGFIQGYICFHKH